MPQKEALRNVCVVAHVDHGKTSLSDALIAATGVFSKRLAARIRYLDSRQDEQERGITMMSSAIALDFTTRGPNGPVKTTLNLIDSPGHIDFSSEVSTASRLSDGALVVVDVVEGVCAQTRNVLRQAWIDNLKPLLVLNKIDRLITELQLSPLDAYLRLAEVINQVNAVMASFYQGDVIGAHATDSAAIVDDPSIYFAPASDNVVFACAYDGWGFNLRQFSHIVGKKLAMDPETLHGQLWEGFYYDPKRGITPIPTKSAKKPLFVTFVLDAIWKLYATIGEVGSDPTALDRLATMITKMNVQVTPRELQARQKEPKALIQLVLSAFLPLPSALLGAIINVLPSPKDAQKLRIPKLVATSAHSECLDKQVLKDMTNCDSEGHVTGFVAKLVSIPKDSIDMAIRMHDAKGDIVDDVMERARRLRALAQTQSAPKKQEPEPGEKLQDEFKVVAKSEAIAAGPSSALESILAAGKAAGMVDSESDHSESESESDYDPFEYEEDPDEVEESAQSDAEPVCEAADVAAETESYIAFTRLYSGTIKPGSTLVVLSPVYDPTVDADKAYPLSSTPHTATRITVNGLFQFKGKEIVSLDSASAGQVVGIQSDAFSELMLKTATIADPRLFDESVGAGRMISLTHEASHLNLPPLLHSTLEPTNFRDLNKLIRGIKRLNLSDPNVRGYVNENGEVVLETSGELHLERCVKDLKERFAQVDLTVGRARVGFRETVIGSSKGTLSVSGGDVEIIVRPYKEADNTIVSSGKLDTFLTISGSVDASEIDLGAISMGFNVALREGPMMAEPVASLEVHIASVTPTSTTTENAIGATKTLIHSLILQAQPRIQLAMYRATIQTTPDLLGKVYPVISKARGKITLEEMKEGTPWFVIEATMPVLTTFGFSEQIRKDTSGGAIATLEFLGFDILEEDPYWVPQTEQEMEEFGDNILSAQGRGFAKAILEDVRHSKGLATDRKVVENAEKQRTLKR